MLYLSILPINPLPKSTLYPADWNIFTHRYQFLVDSLNFLSTCTRPDLIPFVASLLAYNHQISPYHLKADFYTFL